MDDDAKNDPMTRIKRLVYRALRLPPQQGARIERIGRDQLLDAYGDLVLATVAVAIIAELDPADILNAIARGWDLGDRVAKRIDASQLAETKEEGHA